MTIKQKFITILVVIVAILLPLFSNSQELELPLLWTTNQKSFLESAATVADINGDTVGEKNRRLLGKR